MNGPIVPFSPPNANMNMGTRGTTRRPTLRTRPTTSTTSAPTSIATTRGPPQRQLQEQLVQQVMSMDEHSLIDAFHDPMMMALGTMLAMAGAYMAIVMQETAAANAFAIAAASAGKK